MGFLGKSERNDLHRIMTTMVPEMGHWAGFRVKAPSLLVFTVILLIIIHTNCRPHDITQTRSLTPLWHCTLTRLLYSRDKLFAFPCISIAVCGVLQGIIVLIVSRQYFSPAGPLFAFLMNFAQPPGFIIVQAGPEAGLCSAHSILG